MALLQASLFYGGCLFPKRCLKVICKLPFLWRPPSYFFIRYEFASSWALTSGEGGRHIGQLDAKIKNDVRGRVNELVVYYCLKRVLFSYKFFDICFL